MNIPHIEQINSRISYIASSEEPLSSHVGIVKGDSALYLFDVGATPGTLNYLAELDANKSAGGPPYDIIISHFHGDHAWWLTKHREGDRDVKPGDTISTGYTRPGYRNLYVSSQTAKYTCERLNIPAVGGSSATEGEHDHAGEDPSVKSQDIIMDASERIVIDDGVHLEIIPMPSTHAKGCLALMVDDEYLFMGDATYPMQKDGHTVFNSQLLKAQIDLLSSLPADKLLLSHDDKFIRPGKVVLRQLGAVYEKRSKDAPYIRV